MIHAKRNTCTSDGMKRTEPSGDSGVEEWLGFFFLTGYMYSRL